MVTFLKAQTVKMKGAGDDGYCAATSSTTGLFELGAQITAALEQLPPGAAATVRVQHGAGALLAAGALWATSGQGQAPVKKCELPAAVGLRMGLVEQALDKVGLLYPKGDLGLRARWRRVTTSPEAVVGYELAIQAAAGSVCGDVADASRHDHAGDT